MLKFIQLFRDVKRISNALRWDACTQRYNLIGNEGLDKEYKSFKEMALKASDTSRKVINYQHQFEYEIKRIDNLKDDKLKTKESIVSHERCIEDIKRLIDKLINELHDIDIKVNTLIGVSK